MATFGATNLTLSDWAKRVDPGGRVDSIVEVLDNTNEILSDMTFVEGNLPTGHKTTTRTGIPAPTWRLLNYGVQPKKSTTKQVTDTCGMLENYSDIDKALADLNGNTGEFRFSEDIPFIEGMNQEMASTLFYGAASAPEEFVGLMPRYNEKAFTAGTTDNSTSKYNTLNGGGTESDNTSIWLIGWSPNTIHGIFPKGSEAGLSHEDKGQQTLTDAAGGYYEGYRTHYKWDVGLSVRDWRFAVRIANIDLSALATYNSGSDSSANLPRLMVQAINRLPRLGGVRLAFYCNRTIKDWLDVMQMEGGHGGAQTVQRPNQGPLSDFSNPVPVTAFRGIPVRLCDAILDTEAAVTADS